MTTKTRLFVLAGLVLSLSSAARAGEVSPAISGWGQSHPDAASALAGIVQSDPEGARRLFLWNRDHPLRARAFVAWINDQPDQSLDDFIEAHPRWPAVDLVIKPYRATFEAFIDWGRAHPQAARDLASQPRGLSFVGLHLFGDLWDSKTPLAAPTDAPEAADLPSIPPPTSQAR